ncbi:MAG: 1,2-phenylacetyl-CoA epoxidase subunit PaaC [Pseudomonadota bacterium]
MGEMDDLSCLALRLGDDALIHSHRLAEWCGCAPTLEEELALANVALDFLGRARFCLQLVGRRLDSDEDRLAYHRDAREYTNLLLMEQPRGDFAYAMVRQFVMDEFEALYFGQLAASQDPDLAAIAAKSNKEIAYHLRRSRDWIERLGLGTTESRDRLQVALIDVWDHVAELFAMDEVETRLAGASIVPDRSALRDEWLAAVLPRFEAATVEPPAQMPAISGGRRGVHTEHLERLLSQMQSLQRAYPGLAW